MLLNVEPDDVDDDGNLLEEKKPESEGSNYRPPAKRRKEMHKKVSHAMLFFFSLFSSFSNTSLKKVLKCYKINFYYNV